MHCLGVRLCSWSVGALHPQRRRGDHLEAAGISQKALKDLNTPSSDPPTPRLESFTGIGTDLVKGLDVVGQDVAKVVTTVEHVAVRWAWLRAHTRSDRASIAQNGLQEGWKRSELPAAPAMESSQWKTRDFCSASVEHLTEGWKLPLPRRRESSCKGLWSRSAPPSAAQVGAVKSVTHGVARMSMAGSRSSPRSPNRAPDVAESARALTLTTVFK